MVALLSVLLTLFSSITAGYRINQENLIGNTLEKNRVYSQKLAKTTDDYLQSTLQTLGYSAKEIPKYLEVEDSGLFLQNEAERLLNQTTTFNSVVITSNEGEVIAASPESLAIIGKQLNSVGAQQALLERKPLISIPYISITNKLIVFISQPIFDNKGNYFGFVGGTIYLIEDNILNHLLGEHFYQDGSYVYVVDMNGRILYHPKKDRINDIVTENTVIDDIANGISGSKRVINSENTDMLAGYAFLPNAKWGVVSQTPTEIALLPSNDMRDEMLIKTLPFLLFSFIFIILISNKIAFPLNKLSHYARGSMKKDKLEEIANVNAWYYEAIQLEKALVNSLTFFRDKANYFIHESSTDPLTGLVNRRMIDELTNKWVLEETPFAIILFDIDRFKQVNDKYGHNVGDEVLIYLAEEMQKVADDTDICCRYGGEEFILLLPKKTNQEAYETAETLRKKLERTISPCGEIITISSGIAGFPNNAKNVLGLIEKADKSMYEAKETGRNKSIIAD